MSKKKNQRKKEKNKPITHLWGEKDFDWEGLNDSVFFIHKNLVRWGRILVNQSKEKFGQVRVYCTFGWYLIYDIIWPGQYIRSWWPYRLDLAICKSLMPILNWIIIPIQKQVYRWVYRCAVEKWPHLKHEIVAAADYGELFEGYIPGYKHSDYWRKI